jgi:Tol biopolymer transport system component
MCHHYPDTYSGNTSVIVEDEQVIRSPKWDSGGGRVIYYSSLATSIFDFSTGKTTNLSSLQNSVSRPQDWSPDGNQILHIWYDNHRYELRILDVMTENHTTLLGFDTDQILTDVPYPPMPSWVTTLKFRAIQRADWNPVFPDWILIELLPSVEDEAGDTLFFSTNFVYNWKTGEKLSLDQLFPSETILSSGEWSPDGRYLALQTARVEDEIKILSFTPTSGNGQLSLYKSAISENQIIVGWLGAGDLLRTGLIEPSTGDDVEYIAQIIDGKLHSREFLRFPKKTFDQVSSRDWHLAVSEQEKQALASLFK